MSDFVPWRRSKERPNEPQHTASQSDRHDDPPEDEVSRSTDDVPTGRVGTEPDQDEVTTDQIDSSAGEDEPSGSNQDRSPTEPSHPQTSGEGVQAPPNPPDSAFASSRKPLAGWKDTLGAPPAADHEDPPPTVPGPRPDPSAPPVGSMSFRPPVETPASAPSDPPSSAGTDRSTVDRGWGAPPTSPADKPAAPRPIDRVGPRIMAVANQKGGVGKTTTTVNLGAAVAELGHRVLIIDLDPQGNASTGLGINPRSLDASMYDVLLHDVPLDDAIEAAAVRNLFVAPANLDLAGAEIELVPAFSREMRLKNAISSVADDFDLVLIDCPPSLGLLTVNAFAAATEVLVPIQCEYYALEGLGQLLRNVDLVKRNLNASLELSAIVLVMYDARTNLAAQVASEVREHFGSKVCRSVIPRTVRLSEAPSFGQPITVFDPTSRGALAYRDLAMEVVGEPT